MPDQRPPLPPVPESRAVPKKKRRLSLVWVVPIVAALAGAWVAVTKYLSEGPTITIRLESAEGLQAGKTKIHYNGVDIGEVSTIRLSDDHQHAILTAQMAPKTEGFLLEDTLFWVVRPRISGASVSGLGTLISGAYIGMEIGTSHKHKRSFVALEEPPVIETDDPGRFFMLKTPTLGSLNEGTPIFFRRLHAGRVVSYALDKDGQSLNVRVFIDAPYDQYVTPNTRFWHASGIDVSLSASGLDVQTQSLVSILEGGIAFETSATAAVLPPAVPNTLFTLFKNRTAAFKPAARDPHTYQFVFNQSIRGLEVGAPVEFRGIDVGEVVEVDAQVDAQTFEFSAPITVSLDIQRLGVKIVDLPAGQDMNSVRKTLVDALVARGARAQLRSGNLLTGARYIAIDFFPNAPAVVVDWSKDPVELPTLPGEIEALEASVANIIKKIDQMPLKEIGDDLARALAELDRTLISARSTLDNADKLVAPNSVLGQELGNTLAEVSRAAKGLRILADYLEQHPESLLRGKKAGGK